MDANPERMFPGEADEGSDGVMMWLLRYDGSVKDQGELEM
jgi:hypothetical protein